MQANKSEIPNDRGLIRQIIARLDYGEADRMVSEVVDCWQMTPYDVAAAVAFVVQQSPDLNSEQLRDAVAREVAKLGSHRGYCRAQEKLEAELRRTKKGRVRDRIHENFRSVDQRRRDTVTSHWQGERLLKAAGLSDLSQSIPADFVERLRRAVPLHGESNEGGDASTTGEELT